MRRASSRFSALTERGFVEASGTNSSVMRRRRSPRSPSAASLKRPPQFEYPACPSRSPRSPSAASLKLLGARCAEQFVRRSPRSPSAASLKPMLRNEGRVARWAFSALTERGFVEATTATCRCTRSTYAFSALTERGFVEALPPSRRPPRLCLFSALTERGFVEASGSGEKMGRRAARVLRAHRARLR